MIRAGVARQPLDLSSAPAAVEAVAAFSRDLLATLAADGANLICSPFSVLAILAVVRNGATGE